MKVGCAAKHLCGMQSTPIPSVCHHCMQCGALSHPRTECPWAEDDEVCREGHSILNARGPQEHARIEADCAERRRSDRRRGY